MTESTLGHSALRYDYSYACVRVQQLLQECAHCGRIEPLRAVATLDQQASSPLLTQRAGRRGYSKHSVNLPARSCRARLFKLKQRNALQQLYRKVLQDMPLLVRVIAASEKRVP